MSRDTACIDDLTFRFLFPELSRSRLGTKYNTVHIDGECLVQLFFIHIQKRCDNIYTGVIDKDIQPAERLHGPLYKQQLMFLFGNITMDANYIVPSSLALLHGTIDCFCIDIIDDNFETIVCQTFCNSFAKTTTRTAYNSNSRHTDPLHFLAFNSILINKGDLLNDISENSVKINIRHFH